MNISLNKLSKKIFVIILIFSKILAYDHWTNVTDETFKWETSYDNVKWLLFFQKENCEKCSEVSNLLQSVMKKYIDKRVGFVLVDAIKCPWLVNRFNVTYLPKIILLEDNLMYNYYSRYNEKNIMNFIDKKKPIESSLPIPSGARIRYIYKTYGSLLSHKINDSMQYILNKLHIPLKWNKYYTITMGIILLIIFIILSIFTIILFCKIFNDICCCRLCRSKKSKKIKEEKVKEKIKEKTKDKNENDKKVKQKIE